MRTRGRSWVLGFGALLLAVGPLGARGRGAELVQPVEARDGLVLVQERGRAWVEDGTGRRQRAPLRRGERLTELAELGGGWVAAGVGEQRAELGLVVLRGAAGGVERLSAPVAEGALLARPLPLVERGALGGLAWLEGETPHGLAVRAADWSGAEWGPVVTVSAPGPGSQTGLAAAVLDDGSWLLVWSAFDGRDDELLWSRRRGENWSSPEPLAAGNQVPDVTPTVVAVAGGALAVWSRYDGEGYRLVVARLRGDRWEPPRWLGPTGTLMPRFARRDGGLFLLHQRAWPTGWTLLEMAATGRATRRALFDGAGPGRPVVTAAGAGGAVVRWPQGPAAVDVEWEAVP